MLPTKKPATMPLELIELDLHEGIAKKLPKYWSWHRPKPEMVQLQQKMNYSDIIYHVLLSEDKKRN